MRILHTSDWHLGRSLEGRSRLPEQIRFIDELCRITEEESIELVLIAGDVFDTVNPSAAAEELFYEALDRLTNNGQRAVAIVAGNHDSPERLCASSPLAVRHGIILLGLPKEELTSSITSKPGRVNRIAAGQGWVELSIPTSTHSVVLSMLPYPSEARLNEVLTSSLSEETIQLEYSERVKQLLAYRSNSFKKDSVNIVLSHLYVSGGISSESERPIQLGSAPAVNPGAFPSTAHYVALGHLHRPQRIKHAEVPIYYAGSPLAYSFSECGYAKSVTVMELEPNLPAVIKQIPLSSGYPLVKWQAKSGLAEVLTWIEQGKDCDAWIDLEIHLTDALNPAEIQNLRRSRERLINIRPVFPETVDLVREDRTHLPIDEQFRRFYSQRMNGAQADEELVSLFMSFIEQSIINSPEANEEETA